MSNEDLEKACPERKEVFQQVKELEAHAETGNTTETGNKLQTAPRGSGPGSLCEEHGERLQLFCETDGALLCVVCRESQAHRPHRVTPVNEAEQEYKNKIRAEKDKIPSVDEQLCQSLGEKVESPQSRPEAMKKMKMTMLQKVNITELTSPSALITKIEKKCEEPALESLKDKMRAEKDRIPSVDKQGEKVGMLHGRLEAMKKKTKKKTTTMLQNVDITKLTSPSDLITETKKKCEKPALGSLKNKIKVEKDKIPPVDEQLCQSLGDKVESPQGRLEVMKKKMTMLQKVNITELTSPSALITEIEKKCEEPALDFLKDKMSAQKDKIPSVDEQSPGEKGEMLHSRLEATKKKKKKKTMTMLQNGNITKLTSLNAPITEIEKKCEEPALDPLEDFTSTLDRCDNVKSQGPENAMMPYKAMVTLDPDTAHPRLLLSEEERHVRWTDEEQPMPDTPKRFTYWPCVLGSEGFTSGRHYWEVKLLQEGGGWCVGVAAENVERNEWIPWSPKWGVWVVEGWEGQNWALTSPLTLLFPHENPTKLGVFLDYEGGQVPLQCGLLGASLHLPPNPLHREALPNLQSLGSSRAGAGIGATAPV
ncbi:E3 ubiquitin-protein ligase TRIM39-like isoform X2 [Pleurodeles waltl]|uniref:E3 ubiquitin-protein ligase TRIM39-like isoform X2 n=1 Tax=Pleurodeles waltl TaxID=8319 RepID=UPI0037097C5C